MTGNALRVGYYTGNTVNDFVVRAGITGEGGDDSDAIRIWAGTTEENRANADFRVTQGGKLHARNATIEGNITASTGTLGTLYLTGYIDGTNGGSDEEIFEIYHNGNCGCYPLYSLLSRKRQRKG